MSGASPITMKQDGCKARLCGLYIDARLAGKDHAAASQIVRDAAKSEVTNRGGPPTQSTLISWLNAGFPLQFEMVRRGEVDEFPADVLNAIRHGPPEILARVEKALASLDAKKKRKK